MRATEFIIEAANPAQQAAIAIAKKEEQGMAEAIGWEPEFDKRLKKMNPDERFNWDRANDSEYSGQPMTDVGDNWSGDSPVYAPAQPDTLTLHDRITGKVNNYSFDSPEAKAFMKDRFDSELGPDYKGFVDAFKKGADFNANRPKPYTNLATSDSTNDFTDPIKLGQYDVDFPEKTVDNFDAKKGQFTQTVIPSPNNPNAPYQKPAPATSKSQVDLTKFGINPNSAIQTSQPGSAEKENLPSNSNFYVYKSPDQKSAKPVPPKADASKEAPIPAKPKPGSWQELAKLNNITDPRKLKANTWINTPSGQIYVDKGDTLSGIAQRMRPTGVKENIKHQLAQEFEMFLESNIEEDWQKVNHHDKTDGMSGKAVKAYRRENPGSKLKTAVTTKPSKLKKGGKAANRRKSFCARMGGMKKHNASAKTKHDPDSPINKALRRWNCESIEQLQELVMLAEQFVNKRKNESI